MFSDRHQGHPTSQRTVRRFTAQYLITYLIILLHRQRIGESTVGEMRAETPLGNNWGHNERYCESGMYVKKTKQILNTCLAMATLMSGRSPTKTTLWRKTFIWKYSFSYLTQQNYPDVLTVLAGIVVGWTYSILNMQVPKKFHLSGLRNKPCIY